MATNRQKKAARRNPGKARRVQSARAHGADSRSIEERHDVEVSAANWRELSKGGKDRRR